MFVDIVTRAPKILTYAVPPPLCQKIKVGQIVSLPLGNKKTQGLVFNISAKTKYSHIKPIEEIITLKPFLFDYQIKLAKWISDYYCASLYKAISLMFPKALSQIKTSLYSKNSYPSPFTKKQKKPIFLWAPDRKEKEKFYWQKIKNCISKDKQAILLFPKIPLDHSFIVSLLSYNPQKITLLSGKQSHKELSKEWQAIKTNLRKVIIGSQKPLFMPYPKLGLIIIDEEQNDLYKQERTPHYHVSQVALKLAKLTSSEIILSTITPDICSYYKVQKKYYKLVTIYQKNKRTSQLKKKPKITLVNLNKFSYKERIISPPLKKLLNQALSQKEQIILFLNRKGMARSIICPDCGQILNCPSCGLPMAYYAVLPGLKPKVSRLFSPHSARLENKTTDSSYLWCQRCNKKQKVPTQCPKCSSLFITERGLGIQTVKRELKKICPLANIELLDKDIAKSNLNRILTDYLSKKINILIGTQIILGYPELKTSLLGIISADSGLYLPDFESERRTFFLLTSLMKISKNEIVVQSQNPDLPCIKYALRNNFVKFYEIELKKRKVFLYPPFSQIIKLVYSHRNYKRCQNKTQKITNKIKLEAKKYQQLINIIGPSPCFIPKLRDLHRWQIIIKLKLKNAHLLKEEKDFKKQLVKLVGPDWTIDVDPKTLIH